MDIIFLNNLLGLQLKQATDKANLSNLKTASKMHIMKISF